MLLRHIGKLIIVI